MHYVHNDYYVHIAKLSANKTEILKLKVTKDKISPYICRNQFRIFESIIIYKMYVKTLASSRSYGLVNSVSYLILTRA